jgi:hypothetical protein
LIPLPQSCGSSGYGFFIVGKEGTNYGKQVWLATRSKITKIFEVNDGYIVADSRYNTVNYSNNLIALHIRYLEPHSSEFKFYYDGIVIIDATGRVVGSFMFRDLAKFICDIIMKHMKHWKYFRMYFGVMNQAILTRQRYIMSFPDTSPRGLQLITISSEGGFITDIHPEYKPENKIPAGLFAYNFSIDQGEQAEIYRDFSVENAFNFEQTQTYMPLPTSPYVSAYVYILGEDFDKVFVFEPIAVLPKAVLDATAFDLEEKVIDASKALRGDESLIGAFGFYSRGFYNQWFITPNYVGAMSVQFVGWDSGITAFKIDARRIDDVLDIARPAYRTISDPEFKALVMYIEYSKYRDQFVLSDLGGAIEIFWRLGPPMWMYSVYDMYAGLITYVSVEYEDAVHFLNDTPIYVGDLEFKISNYTAKILRRGKDAYIFGWDSTEGTYRLYKGTWGLETVREFDRAKYYVGPEIMIGKNGKDVFLFQGISKQKETFPMIRYKDLIAKDEVMPSKIIGTNAFLALRKDGDIENAPLFSLIFYGWTSQNNKTMTDGGISIIDYYPVGVLGNFVIKGYVDNIVGAFNSAFVEMNDVYSKKYLFADFNGWINELKDFWCEENWYVRKVKEFTTFDKFLADSFEYDTIDIVNANKRLQVLKFLEGEVI